MILRVLSDASYLSRPSAGSVSGSHHFLGDENDDGLLNHPISTHSTRIPVVCSFVAEAEYGALFAAGASPLTNVRCSMTWATLSHQHPYSVITRLLSASPTIASI